MDDVLVIGGGPAGAACALWLHQLGLRALLLEADSEIGGLQRRSPYANQWLPGVQGRTGQEVAANLHAHLLAAAVPHQADFNVVSIRRGAAAGSWEVSSASTTHRARHVVLATGSKPRRAGFEESDEVGIGPGMSIERIDVRGKRVAVLGGGDNAFFTATRSLLRGARGVDLFCRHAPRAQPILRRELPSRCVHVGPFEADQRSMTVDAERYDVISVQFGFEACVPGGMRLPLCEGYIEVDRRGAIPGFPGLFAAGEVTKFWHPCVTTAYAHGVQVAKSIQYEVLAGPAGPAASAGARPAPSVA
ncbi:MAG: FAD-dependent oxidoreductase [Burkholderiaceae bacterium]